MDRWIDFQLLDAGGGEKLEKWGHYILQRPDPQAIWYRPEWKTVDATYVRSPEGGGSWTQNHVPQSWLIRYPSLCGELRFNISLMGFKHTGLFPEQSTNWDFMQKLIAERKERNPAAPIRILNLFAYTGGATLACAAAGATEVVHVDASKRIIGIAKKNVADSKLTDKYIRFIAEDANRFVEREIRRGRVYDGIVLDPPAYGRGPNGELWQFETSIGSLIDNCVRLLSRQAIFLVLNSYTTGLTAGALQSIMNLSVKAKFGGITEGIELILPAKRRDIFLPCGCTGRWQPCN
ncbi:class I SAM-dependent methyltransferase [Mageeibacillus indolicus]|uniref:Uncharacterized protein n=2 Tax=Mageeibacillus indolicus TaxID=884684 RepID=D3R1V9_MAGIU|nr:class I SAM-dependent methyltransferase [Mageeibacillus indolicus]ADC91812.1 hypothetical protein HMPREF0868_0851 [Mageeibacillus indolicus UPII9-5]KFA57455.1 SAM-dependent methyltransferase [Mageeibacillus indolicus 0009-5]PNH19653.1 SAM-dependent methyltransferase [Mageeibacillus indolicus]